MPDLKVLPPRQVMTAVSLMGVNVFLQSIPRTILVVTGILSGRIGSDDAIFKVMDEFVLWGFSIGFLVLIWHGLNWVRWLNLILTVLDFALMFYRIWKLLSAHDLAVIYPGLYVILESTALYLLFLSPGKFWFERSRAVSQATV